MIRYYDLGGDKRLNEIVMAGSHDAGITQGGGNAMTQRLDIFEQAASGVRVFDLRVAGAAVKKHVELKTYHGPLTKMKVKKRVAGVGDKRKVTQSEVMGTWGEGLLEILADARGFVTDNPNEFLILKFDKCKNWDLIAELAVQELADTLFTGSGNVNKMTLFDLRGRVIVVFTEGGLEAIDPAYKLPGGGILGIKSLGAGDAYSKTFNGIQYVGKGGTDLSTRKGKSIQENISKQLDRLQPGVQGNPNVMGMMYWTTTGLVGNIHDRNDMMWKRKHVGEMEQLWRDGLGRAVRTRIPTNVDPASFSGGPILRRFMPNIVMIDFADTRKCKTIYKLNELTATEMTRYEQNLMAAATARMAV